MSDPAIEARELGICFPPPGRAKSLKQRLASWLRRTPPPEPFWALREIDLAVSPGENLGIVGLNGSGKSTLLRSIAGIYQPDVGTLAVRGSVSTVLSLTAGLQQDLTGRENLVMLGALLDIPRDDLKQMLPEITAFSELGEFIDAPVRTYSSGMAARLSFSLVCHLERDILLLDEILGVGDHHFRKKAEERLTKLIAAGRTCVLVSHRVDRIAELCDRAMWLEQGRVRELGPAAEVVAAYEEA